MKIPVTRTEPVLLAPETYLITNMAAGRARRVPAGQLDAHPAARSRSSSTPARPVHREHWLEHGLRPRRPGGRPLGLPLARRRRPHRLRCDQVLEACPNATLVAELLHHRAARTRAGRCPSSGMIWREPGESLRRRRPSAAPGAPADLRRAYDARPGRREDRRAVGGRLVRRVLHRAHVHRVEELPPAMYDETFTLLQQPRLAVAPVARPGPVRPPRRPDRGPASPASSPPHTARSSSATRSTTPSTGCAAWPGQPIVPRPGQAALDEMLSTIDRRLEVRIRRRRRRTCGGRGGWRWPR